MHPSLFASIIATRTRSCDIFWKIDWKGSFKSVATHESRSTPLDLFLLGSLKELYLHDNIQILAHLKELIQNAADQVSSKTRATVGKKYN
jgi:hypothetical protein